MAAHTPRVKNQCALKAREFMVVKLYPIAMIQRVGYIVYGILNVYCHSQILLWV